MSQAYERKCHSRWSEPILRNHYPFHLSPTSEEEVPSHRRSRSSSPLLSITHQYAAAKQASSGCLCHKRCARRRSSKSFEVLDTKRLSQRSQKLRVSLELHLIGTQMEENVTDDKQTGLLQQLELTTSALEALAQYVQSLRVSQLAAHRVLHVNHQLLHSQPSSIKHPIPDLEQLTAQLQQSDIRKERKLIMLQDLIAYCSKHVALSKQVEILVNDHCLRKKDFQIATKNFKDFLDNNKLSVEQMEKLCSQYDNILYDYQQSKRILNLELLKVVNTRLIAIQSLFEKIETFHTDLDYLNTTVSLFKIIGRKLCENDAKIGKEYGEPSDNSSLCENCKINRVTSA